MREQQVLVTEEKGKEVVRMTPQAILTEPKWLTELEEEILGGRRKLVMPGGKECIWMKLGVVSHRICTKAYQCTTCELQQAIEEAEGQGRGELIASGEAIRQRIVVG